jgi:phenylalanyl-tRNA synthetase alpha subunit
MNSNVVVGSMKPGINFDLFLFSAEVRLADLFKMMADFSSVLDKQQQQVKYRYIFVPFT